MIDHSKNAYNLLSIIQSHAPDGEKQMMVADIHNSEPDLKRREKVLAGILWDGLAYGNWPWTNYHLSVTQHE